MRYGRPLSRIAFLSSFILLLANGDGPATLRQTADKSGILVGAAVRPWALSEPAYSATLSREFNMVEPEDAFKWWVVRHEKDSFDFHEGDEIVAFAQAHAMKVRGHCLVWDHSNPEWLEAGHFTPDQMSQLLKEHINRRSDTMYAMLKDFKTRGVPIDGVGLQMHVYPPDFDLSQIGPNMARLTALRLQVHITELDVDLPVDSNGSFPKDDLERQAEIYREVVRVCVQNPGCTAIQTWGFTDKYSWIGSHSHGKRGGALPFDRLYQPKPAYDAMLEEIGNRSVR